MAGKEFTLLTKLAEASAPPLNIAAIGATGVGKSSLINAFFGVDVAAVGVGRPVTMLINAYKVPDHNVQIFDTRGLEIDKSDETVAQIENLILSARKKTDADQHIHIAWVCVSAASKRFEPVYETMAHMLSAAKVYFVIVITKSFGPEALALEKHIRSIEWIKAPIVTLLAAPKVAGGEVIVEAYGLDELADLTAKLIGPARAASANYHRYSAKRREAAMAALQSILERKKFLQHVGNLYARAYGMPVMLAANGMVADKVCEDIEFAATELKVEISSSVKKYMHELVSKSVYDAAIGKAKKDIDNFKAGIEDIASGDFAPIKNLFGKVVEHSKWSLNPVQTWKDTVKWAKGDHVDILGNQAWEYIREITLVALSPIAEAQLAGLSAIDNPINYWRSINAILKWSELPTTISPNLIPILRNVTKDPPSTS